MKQRTCHLLLLGILLLGSFLRFYRLDAQSFWNDEGNSARIAERPPDLILAGSEGDIHPPGYYLLLHYWRALFGQSEFVLRSMSVVAGLALVAFTYLQGHHLFGKAIGLTAAFLGAVSPFAIYYSQEARMYAVLAALSAASTYLLLRLLTTQRSPASTIHYIAVYILTCAAGLYTQYAFPFVLLVHNVTFGLWWLATARQTAHRWRWVALWAGAQAMVVVLYLPWLPVALKSVTGWSSAGRTYDLAPALVDVLRVLSVGITLPVEQATAALVGTSALLLLGLWPAHPTVSSAETTGTARTQRTDPATWLGAASMALYLLVPIALMFAFDLYKPQWLKFLVVVLPPFHILIARGVESVASLTRYAIRNTQYATRVSYCVLRVALRLCLLAVIIALLFPSLHNLYLNPAYARDDYRQLAADVSTSVHASDAIILNAPNQWEVFTYYYPDRDVYPAPYRPTPAEVEAFLTPLIERYRRLFVLYWGDAESDPQRLIETWLAAYAYRAQIRWYGRVRLATYGVDSLPERPAQVLDVHFGEHIRLHGYTLATNRLTPGDILAVTIFWETQAPIAERYKVTVQLLDSAGQLLAQHDTEPRDGLMPTTTWKPDRIVADRYGVPLPADLSPGRYQLIVGLYHIASGERLPVASGDDYVVVCDVEVKGSSGSLSRSDHRTAQSGCAACYVFPLVVD